MAKRCEHNPGYPDAFKRRVVAAYRDILAESAPEIPNGEVKELARSYGVIPRTIRNWARQEAD